MSWSNVRFSEGQKERINLALTVEEESREWAKLTDELALYQGNLTNIPPKRGIDRPLKFKKTEDSSTRRASGAEGVNLEDPKSVDELQESKERRLYYYVVTRKLLSLGSIRFCIY